MGRKRKILHLGKGNKAYLDPDPKFTVPKSIYLKVFEDIKDPNPLEFIKRQHHNLHVPLVVQNLCHSNPKETYSVATKNGLNKSANFQKAAKEALDMRDFKALYKICMKGFELKDKVLSKVLYEYLYIAIENDPLLSAHERELFLMEAVRGCKLMYVAKGSAPFEFESEKAALKHIQASHTLTKRNDDDYEEDEDFKQDDFKIKIEKYDLDEP